MNRPPPLPWFYLLLDLVGALLFVTGVLALAGMDFGYPVLRTVAIPFIVLGVLLFLPLLFWALRRGGRQP